MNTFSQMESLSHEAMAVLDALDGMSEMRSADGPLDRLAARWSKRLLVICGLLLTVLVAMAGVHRVAPLTGHALLAAIWLGIGIQLLSLCALIFTIAAGAISLAAHFRRFGDHCREELAHDHRMAARVMSFSLPAMEAADRWIEAKSNRMERRQIRFFGGSDKLALAAVLGSAWSAWHGLSTKVSTWEPSPLLFGTAFIAGLALGAMANAIKRDRLAYQRDVLAIAVRMAPSREGATLPVPEEVPGSAGEAEGDGPDARRAETSTGGARVQRLRP